MDAFDAFIAEMQRAGARKLVLLSDAPPTLVVDGEEKTLPDPVGHKDLTALIEEVVPPAQFADLVMMEPVAFELDHPAGKLRVRVVPGPSVWRVSVEAPDGPLAPWTAPEDAPSASSDGEDEAAVGREQEAAASDSSDSWSELEREVGGEAPSEPEIAPAGAPDVQGEGEANAAASDASAPEADPESGEYGFVLRPSPEPEPQGGEIAASESRSGKPARRTGSLDGALVRHRESGEFHIEVADSEPAADATEDPAVRRTVQLAAEDLGALDAPAASVPQSDGAGTDPAVRPSAPRQEAGGAGRRVPSAEVEPLEIEFHDEDVPTIPIDRLDALLDRAWRAGGTTVILREGRPPALGVGSVLGALQGGRPEDGRLVHEILDVALPPGQMQQLDIEGFCRFVYRPGGSRTLVRVTLVRDSGGLTAWIRRIGEEHFPAFAARWLPVSVRNLVPDSGLVLVAGGAGQGKTTTAAALAAMCHEALSQTLVVADPLERRLPDEGVGVLQRQIPEDAPSAARALRDALRLDTRLVVVDVPRSDDVAVDLLSLAGQGRLVIATWTAPSCVAAVEALMDALPPALTATERARRARNLRSVVTVRLVGAKAGGVLPIFETLQINQVVLSAVTEARLGQQAGAGRHDLVQLSFDASLAALQSRGLI